jgi:hypothetical protein
MKEKSVIMQKKYILQRDIIPIKNKEKRLVLLPVLVHLAEELDLTSLCTVKMEIFIINQVGA